MPNTLQYYPKLSDLITLDKIPESLSFVQNISQQLFGKIYYKDYQVSISSLGESAFHSLSIVAKDRIGFDLPFGLKFVLNRDYQISTISSFPVTVKYNWPIIAYIKQFNLANFSFSAEEIFNIALVSLNLTETTVINEAINVFVNTTGDPIQKFVDDLNYELGNGLNAPIPYPTSSDRLGELVDSINQSYGNGAAYAAFATYILQNGNLAQTKSNLKLFFKAILPTDIEEYIKDIITPRALVTLETSASIEFPNNVLKPWTIINGVLTPVNGQNTYFDFAKAVFYADTTHGIGYNVDIAGTLNPDYAEIGNTGLLLQINRLKLDLSKKRNIPEADYYGYASDFVGVYARAVSVTFPPKWFHDDNSMQGNSTTTLRLGGYDLLLGTGGVTGTIMLESVPITTGGTAFEYYNDKFAFNYPITIYDTDPLTNEVIEVTVNDYQELKNILQQLNSSSSAPYPFKFPFSLTPVGQVDPIVFGNPQNYQAYLATLNNNILWKKLGGPNGFQVGFTSFDVTLLKNSVVSSNIAGSLKIPRFKYPDNIPNVGGQPVQIDVTGHLDGNGDFLLTASTYPPFPIQFGNVFKLHLHSIELGKEGNDFFIGASADIEFLGFLGNLLEGQTISVSSLRIYSNGRIDFRVNGGNLTLPKPIKLKIGPTELSVTAIHFGSHERERRDKDGQIRMRRYNYFGFDGGVNVGLVGLDARGDGIKYYYTIDDDEDAGKDHHSYLHIQTIYVDLIIPANSADPSVTIKGWLSIPEPGAAFQEYAGGVDLKIKNPRINGKVDMRLAPKYPAFLIEAGIELPNPIALGPVSIYGFKGLLGYRYVAEKKAIGMTSQNTWYQYYTAPQRGVNVRKFSRPDQTENYGFPFSLGVGAILGDTMAAGTIISANAMLLLSLPSMIMVDARMKLLSSRVSFADDPPFFAFFIFGDNSLEFGFGADYKFPESSGDIIKLYAEIQAGFFFNNPSAWYINFGTQQQPITAKLLKEIFTLKAYLMISGKGIQAGARGEFRFDRKYGPVRVFVLAYLEVGGKISFQSPQMGAYIEAGLAIDINVKIFRIYLAVSILLAVESPKPFLIYGAFMLEFKINLFIFKLKFKVKVELKWEFNKEVDRTPINPFTELHGQMENLVKGISMLTNETFDLAFLGYRDWKTNTINIDSEKIKEKVIPLDTYIDIKTTKGLLPGNGTSNIIGGYTNPAGHYTDLVPPDKNIKGLELRQVKHQYSVESIEILAETNIGWRPYNPYVAMHPSDAATFGGLKVGQWQKKDSQYNAIRLLATTPFSYTEQGNPGWFIPEQYGIMPSTLFCKGQEIQAFVSDFLDKPLNSVYYASSSNFFHSKGASYQLQGDVVYVVNADGSVTMVGPHTEVSDEANNFGFTQSLAFPNENPLTIMLSAPSLKIDLKLSTFSTGLTITFYIPDPNSTPYAPLYSIAEQLYLTKDELMDVVKYDTVDTSKGVTKIVITPDTPDYGQINLILEQMEILMDEGYQIALYQGGEIKDIQPSNPELYAELSAQLDKLQSMGCNGVKPELYEIACKVYPELLDISNNNFSKPYPMYFGETPDPDEEKKKYAEFIKNNIDRYIHVAEILNSMDVDNQLFKINTELYQNYLSELGSFGYENPDDFDGIIFRFEALKSKFSQIINWMEGVRPCEDQILCDLAEYLSYQDFGHFADKPPVSESPMLNAYYLFIRQNPGYRYLNDYLDRQISYIQTIVNNGWIAYLMNQQNYNDACLDMISLIRSLGNCGETKKCFTLFHEVKWLTVEDYIYNENIPGQAAIQGETQAAINAIGKSVQPIWRPDTKYLVKFTLRDLVDNISNPNQQFEFVYGFRTAGPLGFFHLDKQSTYGDLYVDNSPNIIEDTIGVLRDPQWNIINDDLTPHPDLYPHTSLRAYIDYERSYPNADGNLVSAKPLFYNDETTEIRLYFNKLYASKLLEGWDEMKVGTEILFDKLGGDMKIIIKDPVEGTEIINPPSLDAVIEDIEIPQTIETWQEDEDVPIPAVYQQYFEMLKNKQCQGVIEIIKPKSFFRKVTPKMLKPQKLYTVQVLNFYWGKNIVDTSHLTDEIKKDFSKEVHKFVFQTSRYADFKEQTESCLIHYKDQDGNEQVKQAVYIIEKYLEPVKITAALDLIKGTTNTLAAELSLQYHDPFDRIMQGLFGISPLEAATTTEFNKIIDKGSGKVIAVLIRNPEPFNHPRIPLKEIMRRSNPDNPQGPNLPGIIEVVNLTSPTNPTINENYHWVFSKDYSCALFMNDEKWINSDRLDFQFIYKKWNGNIYTDSDHVIIENIKIN